MKRHILTLVLGVGFALAASHALADDYVVGRSATAPAAQQTQLLSTNVDGAAATQVGWYRPYGAYYRPYRPYYAYRPYVYAPAPAYYGPPAYYGGYYGPGYYYGPRYYRGGYLW